MFLKPRTLLIAGQIMKVDLKANYTIETMP